MSITDMFSLKGKTAVITGAERGIGLELALGFAEAGADIVIAGIMEELFEEARERILEHGVKCICVRTDVSKEESVQESLKKIQEVFPTIDILVNNAGINKQEPAESMSLDTWNRIINVNLTGTFLMSREVGSLMLKQGQGTIVNIASMSGLVVNPLPQIQCAYNSSKAGVIMLTKCMANEWAERGVRVNAIAPGFMKTPLTAHRLTKPDDPVAKKWLGGTPMNRIGEPKELVGLALYFASEASSYTTGTVLQVDGGYTCL